MFKHVNVYSLKTVVGLHNLTYFLNIIVTLIQRYVYQVETCFRQLICLSKTALIYKQIRIFFIVEVIINKKVIFLINCFVFSALKVPWTRCQPVYSKVGFLSRYYSWHISSFIIYQINWATRNTTNMSMEWTNTGWRVFFKQKRKILLSTRNIRCFV